MDEELVNYNIEQYTDDPSIIQRVNDIQRMVNERYSEVQGIIRILNRTSPIVQRNRNGDIAYEMIQLSERGQLINRQIELLDASAREIIRNLQRQNRNTNNTSGKGLKRGKKNRKN